MDIDSFTVTVQPLSLEVMHRQFLPGDIAQGVPINKLSNARTSKVCMLCPMDTVPKELESRRAVQEFCMILYNY